MSTQEKKKENKYIRRSGTKIMASLVVLLGSLSYIMILAVINGSLGFISAMGVTVFGAMGVAKALGEQIALSYGWIIGLTVGCGLIRGLLRYIEQYSNHYIAFRLLAAFRRNQNFFARREKTRRYASRISGENTGSGG